MIAALGIYRAGGVVVPVNTRFKADEATYILDRTKAKLLFTVTDFLDTDYVAMLRSGVPVPSLETVVVIRGDAPAGTISWDDVPRRGRGRRPGRDRRVAKLRVTGDTVSDIIFTSGTTGRPKGAMLTHGASVAAYDAWTTVVGLRARRPLPDRQPVLPHVRLEGRDPRVPHHRHHDRARTPSSTSTR